VDIVILIIFVVIVEALLHYFPWRLLLRGKELPRLVAYILGVIGLMVPFSVWVVVVLTDWRLVAVLWGTIVAGGITVMILYGLDHVVDLEWRKRECDQREKELRNTISDQEAHQ
jgi:branched-subunit amino acid transport protein AzlD